METRNGYTILIVEDEKPLSDCIKTKAEKEGFEAVTARSVEQAVNLLKDIENISAVWLDHYLLGKEDGLDFVAKVKENEKWKDIPVFVVSNTASPEKVNTYLRLGANKYYVKANSRLDQILGDIKEFLSNNN